MGSPDKSAAKPTGYGLPCANCRLYYPADLDNCPTCSHHERVSPKVPKVPVQRAEAVANPVVDNAVIEQERQEFLRQFKSQRKDTHADVAQTAGATCILGEHRAGDDGGAVICQACYEHLQERLDVCEAALHIDAKEAAQIVYDAVWAEPSDPSRTYMNAASALLAEVRKRAGMNALSGAFQPLSG